MMSTILHSVRVERLEKLHYQESDPFLSNEYNHHLFQAAHAFVIVQLTDANTSKRLLVYFS